MKIETKCLHEGYHPKNTEPRVIPIVQSTTYVYDSTDDVAAVFDDPTKSLIYSRFENPTVMAVEEKIAALEGGAAAMATSSGQAATLCSLLNICSAGDSFISTGTIYGGTVNLFAVTLKKLGIECFVLNADIPQIAKDTNVSEETAGRNVRYNFFNKLCEKYDINKVATAHNRNDNAETLLMNFMRGSTTNGLCGIPYVRGNIIRPILNVSRDEIEKYCSDNRLEYMTDSTNLTEDYTRNKIRHTLLPYIQKEFNTSFIKTVTENACLIKDDSDYLDGIAEDFYKHHIRNCAVNIEDLNNTDIAIKRRVLRLMLRDIYNGLNDISSTYVADILSLADKSSGRQINLPYGIVAKNEYGKIILEHEKKETQPFEVSINIGETVFISELDKKISVSETDMRNKDGAIYLSCDKTDKIIVRNRRNGDKFQPMGMNGTKKLKEYFIDKKIPKDKRNSVPIIEINGEIAAVGNRIDKRFAFKDKGIKIEFYDN